MQVLMNYEIGKRIVEHEQKGNLRADYGKGFDKRSLQLMRQFYISYSSKVNTVSSQLAIGFKLS